MIEGIYYQVGDATAPQEDDSIFLELDAAIEDALLNADEEDYVVAIWELSEEIGHAFIHRLVFRGSVWTPSP